MTPPSKKPRSAGTPGAANQHPNPLENDPILNYDPGYFPIDGEGLESVNIFATSGPTAPAQKLEAYKAIDEFQIRRHIQQLTGVILDINDFDADDYRALEERLIARMDRESLNIYRSMKVNYISSAVVRYYDKISAIEKDIKFE